VDENYLDSFPYHTYIFLILFSFFLIVGIYMADMMGGDGKAATLIAEKPEISTRGAAASTFASTFAATAKTMGLAMMKISRQILVPHILPIMTGVVILLQLYILNEMRGMKAAFAAVSSTMMEQHQMQMQQGQISCPTSMDFIPTLGDDEESS
jgi:hypothetical protein